MRTLTQKLADSYPSGGIYNQTAHKEISTVLIHEIIKYLISDYLAFLYLEMSKKQRQHIMVQPIKFKGKKSNAL